MNQRSVELLDFLDRLRAEQDGVHPGFGAAKVISFLGTTGAPGQLPAFAPATLAAVEPDPEHGAIAVRLGGALQRRPAPGETVSVSIVDVAGYRGFQLKSPAMAASGPASRAVASATGGTRVTCPHAYTVRAEPSAASFFERIPVEEIQDAARAVPHALVAVGRQANVSPRFVYHWEPATDGVALFHGDSQLNKTFYNVRVNQRALRLVLDLHTYSGYALDTRLEEAHPERDRAAIQRITSCFAAAGFRANRIYRSVATSWHRVAPAA